MSYGFVLDDADYLDCWGSLGTLDDPIMVNSFGDEQYCGCTGCPADSHSTKWITVSSPSRYDLWLCIWI